MKKTVAVILCGVMLLAGAPVQFVYGQATGKKLTLKDAIETGLKNNLDVQQSDVQAKTDEINWKQAKLNRYPDLTGTAGNGINQGRSIDPFTNSYINQQINYASYGLSSGVVLFNGLSMQNTVKQTSLAYKASKMDWQQAKDNLTINVILAYLQVLSNEDILQQAKDQATVSKQEVDRLSEMNKQGAISPSLLTDMQGQYAGDQLSIINSENALETSKIFLSQLMNVPYDKEVQLERLDPTAFTGKYEETASAIYQTALKQFSLVKAAEFRFQSAEKGVKAAKGTLFPTLSLNGNVNTNYSNAAYNDIFVNTTDEVSSDYVIVNGTPTQVIRKTSNFRSEKIAYGKQLDNNLFTSISLNLRIPLFNSFQARNRVKIAQLTMKNTNLALQTTKTQLQQSIEQAYANMTSASARYKVLLEQVTAFTESFRAADIRFKAGLGTSNDYFIAKNNLDRARINLITAKYDFVLRAKILDYYQGRQLW